MRARASAGGLYAALALGVGGVVAPMVGNAAESPHMMWRRGLLPRRQRARSVCGCRDCAAFMAGGGRRW